LGRTDSPTSARRGDGFGYIRIWAILARRLVFWNGAPSPTKKTSSKIRISTNRIKIFKDKSI